MFRCTLGFAIACALLALTPTPAQAHTWSELNDWLTDWDRRFERAWRAESLDPSTPDAALVALEVEYEDMRARHPAWDGELQAAPEPVSSHVSAPAPTVTPAPPVVTAGVEQWRSLVSVYFPSDQVERALCIMGHESGGNPLADNPRSSAAGLFQFLSSTWDNIVPASVTGGSYASGQVYNPEANIRAAAWLWGALGWTQWSPYNRGLCR